MTCEVLTTPESPIQIIACGPTKLAKRFKGDCKDCTRKTNWVMRFDGPYYGYTEHCMGGCESTWQEGSKLGKYPDSARYWRSLWNNSLSAREFNARINLMYEDEFSG